MSIRKWKKSGVLQQDHSDCGVACLATVIRYYGGAFRLEQIREWSGTTQQGTSLLGLYQAANECGFIANGCESDLRGLREHARPVILHVELDNQLEHYVVCWQLSNENVWLSDPAKGLEKWSLKQLEKHWKSRTCLTLMPGANFEQKESNRKRQKDWVLQLIRKDFQTLGVATGIGLLTAVLGIALAVFIQLLIDSIIPSKELTRIVGGVGLLGFILIIKALLQSVRTQLLITQSKEFNIRVVSHFFAQLLRLPKTFFDSRRKGDMIARLNDTRRIQAFLTHTTGQVAVHFLSLIVTLFAVFIYNSTVGWITVVVIPLYITLLAVYNRKIVRKQRKVMEHYAHAESNYINTLEGVDSIKNETATDRYTQKNHSIFSRFQNHFCELGEISIRVQLVIDVLGTLFLLTTIGTCAMLLQRGQIKTGELVAIITLSSSALPMISVILISVIKFQEARIAFDRMFEFSDMPKEESGNGKLLNRIEEVRVQNLSFRFPGRSKLLEHVSFRLFRNNIAAIVGESGSGKSTLASLLLRHYTSEEGIIVVDGIDVNKIELNDWRNRIGVIPQNIHLFNGSVLDNILMIDAKEERVRLLIEKLEEDGLMHFVNRLPNGLNTKVGEDGVNISGGQKQLIAFIRAIYSNPDILIVDEGTSAMDREMEQQVLSLIRKYKKNMMVLFITHRIHILRRFADKIYLLKESHIDESGTPDELMLTKNFYSEFWNELA